MNSQTIESREIERNTLNFWRMDILCVRVFVNCTTHTRIHVSFLLRYTFCKRCKNYYSLVLAEMNDTRLLCVCIMFVCCNIFWTCWEPRIEKKTNELNVDCNKWHTSIHAYGNCWWIEKIENKCKNELEWAHALTINRVLTCGLTFIIEPVDGLTHTHTHTQAQQYTSFN